jgi:hypothetical protein
LAHTLAVLGLDQLPKCKLSLAADLSKLNTKSRAITTHLTHEHHARFVNEVAILVESFVPASRLTNGNRKDGLKLASRFDAVAVTERVPHVVSVFSINIVKNERPAQMSIS